MFPQAERERRKAAKERKESNQKAALKAVGQKITKAANPEAHDEEQEGAQVTGQNRLSLSQWGLDCFFGSGLVATRLSMGTFSE